MAFSLVVVQRHRPIHHIGANSSGNSWCNSKETKIESDDYGHPRTVDCYVGNDSNNEPQQNSHPSFSRRKILSSTTAGIVTGSITSDIVSSQPAFASQGNDAAAINTTNDVVLLDDRLVVRQYAGAFLEKMLEELQAGNEKGVEHVFRNLALFLSPPITALDGGGVPLARLRKNIPPKVVERFDGLSLNGARLADVILSRIPYQGKSAYDKDRVLVASQEFPNSPSKQVDAMFASIWMTTPLEDFQTGRGR